MVNFLGVVLLPIMLLAALPAFGQITWDGCTDIRGIPVASVLDNSLQGRRESIDRFEWNPCNSVQPTCSQPISTCYKALVVRARMWPPCTWS